MKPQAYYLIGPPASGKGTHCKLIGSLPGFFHFSMGQAFRSLNPKSSQEQEEMRQVHEQTSQGYLADDAIAYRIFEEYFQGLIASRRFDPENEVLILDGIPRRHSQAEWLESKVNLVKVSKLICDENVIRERVMQRAMKEGRADDKHDVVKTRLQVYFEELEPLMSFFDPQQVVEIDSHNTPLRVLRQVLKVIDED